MGISRSELFPGFNRYTTEWKSPLIRSFVPEPDHRHSAQRQQRAHNVSAFAPLECKGIRSASRRWWSFQSLWWSQLLTSVPIEYCTPNSLFDMTNDYLFEMNMTFISKWGFAPAWYSHSALCKLSFALVNDKLQEAEYDKHWLPKAGARTVLLKW